MKHFFIIIIASFLVVPAFSQDYNYEKQQLKELVEQREKQFGDYAKAAASRSGFFGNKTKNDLKKQLEIMTQIIRIDNRINSTLNHFLDYRTFQKTEMTYSQKELDDQNRRLNEITSTLSGKLEVAEASRKSFHLRLKWAKVLNWLLALCVVYISYRWWREKKLRLRLEKSSMN